MSEPYRTTMQPCPACGRPIDAHTYAPLDKEPPTPPKPGDCTACFYCVTALEFDPLMKLAVIADLDARTDIDDDTKFRVRHVQQKIRRYWKERRGLL